MAAQDKRRYIVLEQLSGGAGSTGADRLIPDSTWKRVDDVTARNERHALWLTAQRLGASDLDRVAITARSWHPRGSEPDGRVKIT